MSENHGSTDFRSLSQPREKKGEKKENYVDSHLDAFGKEFRRPSVIRARHLANLSVSWGPPDPRGPRELAWSVREPDRRFANFSVTILKIGCRSWHVPERE